MQTIEIITESFLFKTATESFRAIPFYELSIKEWIVYEDSKPTYYINLDRTDDTIIQLIISRVNAKESMEDIILDLGKSTGRQWTLKHSIAGESLLDSWQTEKVKIYLLTDIKEITG